LRELRGKSARIVEKIQVSKKNSKVVAEKPKATEEIQS
jgi:hypothetical protein